MIPNYRAPGPLLREIYAAPYFLRQKFLQPETTDHRAPERARAERARECDDVTIRRIFFEQETRNKVTLQVVHDFKRTHLCLAA